MADEFKNYQSNITGPSQNALAVTPSDTEDLPFVSRGLGVDADGAVSYVPLGVQGDATVTRFLVAGVIHPIRARRIRATGTTATGIVVDW
ncbi:MAG: hypothetical protein H5U19_14705 [Rhodobacteraceae bacterium]|nr:hypothetical protein [Paracoccaceae bacterium]